MFVINPDPYSLPTYRIGPFQTKDLRLNNDLPVNNDIDDYLNDRFAGSTYRYTYNGRSAINVALSHFDLKKEDVVTILTTSGNFYISSCVTDEISKFCKWSRTILPQTRVLFVNHEFGNPFSGLRMIKEYNLPIIEDCASSFFSDDLEHSIGNIGDFVIYSFPKMFPIQIGGLLRARQNSVAGRNIEIKPELLQYIKNVLSAYIHSSGEIIQQRIANYENLKVKFQSLGFSERFECNKGVVPGVFMFRTNNHNIDLQELKKHFWAHGIHSSVFYGEKAFFIPVHQALMPQDLEYFFEVMKAFLSIQKT